MADGDRIPSVRIAYPVLEDFGYLARHMRPDEIAQYLALSVWIVIVLIWRLDSWQRLRDMSG